MSSGPAAAMARYVAVEQDPLAGDAARDREADDGRARISRERLQGAALPAAWEQWPPIGGLFVLLAACGTIGAPSAPPLLLATWAVACLIVTVTMAGATRLAGGTPPAWAHPALALSACACLAVPPTWAPVAAAPLPLAAACAFAAATAALLAARPAAWLPCVPLPAVASVVLAGRVDGAAWPWLTAGLLSSVAALGIGLARLRAWTRLRITLFRQADRIAALEAELGQARRLGDERSRFLAIASHDLRQPVHALALFTATLHRRLHGRPEEPLLRNMVRALDGLERSFNAMLDVSRMDAGALTPALQTFALRDLFRRLHMQYAGQAELAGLGLRLSPGGKSVTSDPQVLERILGNLVQNAIKYTERGGIVVVARSTATHVNLEVWDTGVGIAPADLPRIFDEFYQVGRSERDRARGLGMGLAIVQRLVRLLGCRLEVASRVGRGTMFRVGIPTGELQGLSMTVAPADTVPMEVTEPRMVLVIDDEEAIRDGLRLLLEEWGFQSVVAADAAQAEACVRALEGRVDLIVSDLHLGDGPDGLEAIGNVRRLCGQDVPAILVTGDTTGDRMRPVAAAGLVVLFKPIQPRRLYDAICSQIG